MSLQPVALINLVGLTPRHIGENTPRLLELSKKGFLSPLGGVLPAVTMPAQATLLTGTLPWHHGIVGNGWFFRETGEVRFWLQSNSLIHGETLYQRARQLAAERGDRFTCAKLFWWFNQGAPVEYSVTPKPYYGADGSKIFAIDSFPDALAPALEATLGSFPFPSFWGPMAGLPSSKWIARAAADVMRRERPTLTLVYLPHLDYDLQRFGRDHTGLLNTLKELDHVAGIVFDAAREIGATIVVVSEYGLVPVRRPIYINRVLREQGWLMVRDGPFGETLETFKSRAFAVVDHQVAHVYVHHADDLNSVRVAIEKVPGVAQILEGQAKTDAGLHHARAGDLVLLADQDAWFAYPYWLNERRAPDFARTVDIHRKPGYDPCELLIDPNLTLPKLRVGLTLLKKWSGMRYLMTIVPLDASLIKGSHGLLPRDPQDGPVFLTEGPKPDLPIHMTQIKGYILNLLFGERNGVT